MTIRVDRLIERIDELTGERVRLRLIAEVDVEAADHEKVAQSVVEAVCGAMAFGQHKFGILLDEMDSRRGSVEEAARLVIEQALSASGSPIAAFRLLGVACEPDELHQPTPHGAGALDSRTK